MLNRKHHCRACGSVVCDQHSSGRVVLLNVHETDKQRVCDKCLVEKVNEVAAPINSTPANNSGPTSTVQSPIKNNSAGATTVSNPLSAAKPPPINSPAPSAPPALAPKPPPVTAPKPSPAAKPADNRFSMKFFSRPLSMPFSPPPPVPYAWPTQVQAPPPPPVVVEQAQPVAAPQAAIEVKPEPVLTNTAPPLTAAVPTAVPGTVEVSCDTGKEIASANIHDADISDPSAAVTPPRPKLGALLGEIESGTKLNDVSNKPKIGSLLGEIRSGAQLKSTETPTSRPNMGSVLGDIQSGSKLKSNNSPALPAKPAGPPKPDFLKDIKQGGSKLKATTPMAAAAPKQPTGLLGMLAMKMQQRREFVNKAEGSDDESERSGFSDSDSD